MTTDGQPRGVRAVVNGERVDVWLRDTDEASFVLSLSAFEARESVRQLSKATSIAEDRQRTAIHHVFSCDEKTVGVRRIDSGIFVAINGTDCVLSRESAKRFAAMLIEEAEP